MNEKGDDRGFQGFGGGREGRGGEKEGRKRKIQYPSSIQQKVGLQGEKKSKERKWMLREYTKEIGKNNPKCMIKVNVDR